MLLTRTKLSEETIARLCDEWSDIHNKLGLIPIPHEFTKEKNKFIVPLLCNDKTVDKIIFPKTGLVTQLKKEPGECSLFMKIVPASPFCQVLLVNNEYEASRRKAGSDWLSQKKQNLRQATIQEMEGKDFDLEQLKQEYKDLFQRLKKLKSMIDILSEQ